MKKDMAKKNSNLWDVIIIGAGASGLMAAVTAARAGQRVLILEQKNDIGKKILATGNGKCNFTNQKIDSSCYNGEKKLIELVFSRFTRDNCLDFFHEIGIFPKEKNGYYYPNSETAVSVVEAFRQELKRCKITVMTETCVQEISPKYVGLDVRTDKGVFTGSKLIIAVGLLASPKLGSDGSLMNEIKELGHGFTPIVPALCGFYANGLNFKKVQGVRVRTSVTLELEKEILGQDTGEVQLTDYGISGIPVFQISRMASMGLYHKKAPIVHMNFLPDLTKEDLIEEMNFRRARFQDSETLSTLFNGLLPQKLIEALLLEEKLDKNISILELTDQQCKKMCHRIQNCSVTLTKSRGFEFAQVCAGGIRTEDVDAETLESRLVKGLYFAGEILDVDGICGGYNLQWAWTSGYVAGQAASETGRSKIYEEIKHKRNDHRG